MTPGLLSCSNLVDAVECLELPQDQTSPSVALMSQNDPFRTFALCRTRCVTAHRTREVGLHQATHKVD
jgi:hypothetical protein